MPTNTQRIAALEALHPAGKHPDFAAKTHSHVPEPVPVPPPPTPPPAPPPAPAPGALLMDTSIEGWAKWGPVFHRDDPGFGQDSDFGHTMEQISVGPNNVLTGKAERKPTRSGRKYASFAFGTSVYNSDTHVIQDRFSFLYGTLETRVKHPAGQGVFAAAMWLLRAGSNQTPPEVDVQEALPGLVGGNGPNLITHTNWYVGPNGVETAEVVNGLTYLPVGGKDWTLAPHTYRWVWTPTYMDYFVDGVLTGRHVRVPQVRMSPLINLAMGTGPGTAYKTDATTPASLSMVIDYVKVWAP